MNHIYSIKINNKRHKIVINLPGYTLITILESSVKNRIDSIDNRLLLSGKLMWRII